MRFGIFYEHQLPRPWGEDDEYRLLQDALDQVALADRVGIDSVWAVEHHFLEEYSHSSASDVFLAAASQRTQRIRLGLGILPLPPAYNHPARVAETVATLDLVSGGRVEFGTGETSSGAELEGFGVDRDDQARAVGAGPRRGHADVRRGAVRRRRRPLRLDAAAQRRAQAACSNPTRRCGWPARGARRSAWPPRRASAR